MIHLITGGAGFIGSRLAAALQQIGHRAVVFDNFHPQVHGPAPGLNNTGSLVVRGDVCDPTAWDRLLADEEPDVIWHLAAETGTGQSLDESARHALVNVAGTAQMLDALGRHAVAPARMVLTSSRAVYGEGEWWTGQQAQAASPRSAEQLANGQWLPLWGETPMDNPLPSRADRSTARPTSVYAGTKLAQEHLMGAWGLAKGVPVTILRLQNVYGVGQPPSNPYTGIIPLFARLALQGAAIPLYEDGGITRDFIYVDDAVRALMAAAELPVQQAGCTLDVGSGHETSLSLVATILAELAGAPTPEVTGQYRAGDVRAAFCDMAITAERLGFSARVRLEEGLERVLRWQLGENGA